jgi:cytochrome P450
MKYWNKLQGQIRDHTAPECFVKHLAESNYQEKGISEIQAAYISGSTPRYLPLLIAAMIEAGSETTSATLNSALLHLVANPECITRAHEELEKVIPPGRGPTFDDEPKLPYIRSIVKEILRMKPVASVGSPHCTTEDIVYKDMWIPKGTIITIFQWGIHADPTRWEDPEKFMPERYLDVIILKYD